MKNVKLLALLLALALLLTGCSSKKEAKDIEAVRVGGVSYSMEDLTDAEEALKANYDYYNEMYMMLYGAPYYQYTDEDLRSRALESLAVQAVLLNKAAELKLDKLTEEEKAEVYALAESDWVYYRDSYAQGLELAEDASQAEISAAVDAAMKEEGVNWDLVYTSAWRNYVMGKTEEYMVRDAKVTEEAFTAAYTAQVASDKARYEADPSAFVDALNAGSTPYYAPAGCRYVKQILIQYTEEDQALVSDANAELMTAKEAAEAALAEASALLGEEADLATLIAEATAAEPATNLIAELTEEQAAAVKALAEAQAAADAAVEKYELAVETALANIAPVADEVIARADAGEDWTALTAEYNDDPGMMAGRATAETGYAVCADMKSFDKAFVDAAMGIEAIDGRSDKIVGESYGYYIIKYVGDILEGEVSAEAVRGELTATLLESEQQSAYDAMLDKWVSEANIQINYDKVWEGYNVQ